MGYQLLIANEDITPAATRTRGALQRRTAVREAIRARLLRTIRGYFKAQSDPTGAPWQPLNPGYRQQKLAGGFSGQILIKTGDLEADIDTKRVGGGVDAYSAMPYSATHHFGDRSRSIAARPYLDIAEPEEMAYGEFYLDAIERAWG